MPEGLVGLPGGCCLVVGPEWRGEAGRSETWAGILRLGAALAGKADAVQGGRYGVLRSLLGMSGGWDGPVWSSPRAARFGQAVARRPQKKPSTRRAFVIPDGTGRLPGLPSGGGTTCRQQGGHAVPSEKMSGKGSALRRGPPSHAGGPFLFDGFRLWPP